MINIRKAEATDAATILHLVRNLAIFERAETEVSNTEERMLQEGFGEHPAFFAYLAFDEDKAIGFALGYYRYSTWKGKTIYLEDLYVEEPYRKRGVGNALLETLAAKAKNENIAYIDLQVLDWNEPAISFYKKFDGRFDNSWINVRLRVEKLA